MRSLKTLAAGGVAVLALAAPPLVAYADTVAALPAQSDGIMVMTKSTTGTPPFAALLNAGTQQEAQIMAAYNRGAGAVEVAGVQLGDEGAGLQTLSTSGSPMQAAVLNTGTSYSAAFSSGAMVAR
jgi:hypothetical protein